jgi:hypothetical protein
MLILTGLCGSMALAQANDAPAHGRPFFMPAQERTRIRQLIATQEWAKADYARIQEAARKGDGFLAAFLYARDGDPVYLPIAQRWLLERFGANAGSTKRAQGALDNPEFFKAGVPHLSDVFYDVDFSPYLAFDWVHSGLEPAARREIQEGIAAFMHFKMRCMDRWTQTPNLVFKPTAIVAFAGLAIQERELIEWGLYRKPGSSIGGYFPVLDRMLKDSGPWHEAPIYPIAHTDLYCMGMVSRYRALYDGKDWWTARAPNGGSPKGLMDYYIDSAYPIERTGYGPGQIRVATYGDGATNANGDLFLVNPAGPALDITQALIAAYNTSGDPRLAPFAAMIPDYKPTLIDRRPLPEKIEFPAVSSKIWPDYGLAILREEESPAYWKSDAPVVFHLMTKGYGHDHADKFSITFHGAGRLLYPDYNAIQYENANIGWTRNTIAHNTLMVDEGDTRNAQPSDVRHAFTPEVKYLVVSASGVFEKVAQTRALLLTREYLLDLFQASSPTPRTFDYMLHSFGTPRPAHPELFKPSNALDKRFWLVSDRQAMATDKAWALDFVIKKEESGSRKRKFGPEWYDHTAAVRVTMAAEPKTLVTHGISGIELGKAVKRTFDPLGMLIARRAGIRQTVFVATHEPYANAAKPQITAVTRWAKTDNAILVRVDAADFTDYAAVAFGPQPGTPEHVLAAADDPKTRVAFKDYGYLRVRKDGTMVARGGWTGFSLPAAKAALTLNGQPARATVAGGYLVFGILPATQTAPVEAECPFPVTADTAVVRLAQGTRRAMAFTVKNTLQQSITGAMAFDLPAGVTVEFAAPQFGPLAPGATADVQVTCIAGRDAALGKRLIPYRVSYRTDKAPQEIRTAALPLHLVVNSALEYVYRYPERNVFRVTAERYIAEMDMDHGLTRYLADDDETVRLNGSPLFTFSDGKKPWLFEGCKNNSTWPVAVPAALTGAPSSYGDCRYRMDFRPDRITVHMDAGWTQFDPTYFTVPGQWLSPQGAPTWARIIAVDANRKEVEAKPGTELKIAAAELVFPGAKWHLAFAFTRPQPVTFNGTEMRFPIGSLNGDAWSVGFCKPGELDAWRKGQ